MKGNRDQARDQYDRGRKLCGQTKHKTCVETAKHLKKYGYTAD